MMDEARTIGIREAMADPAWTRDFPSAFAHPGYLAAAARGGPAPGRPLLLEADAGGKGPTRWGLVEYAKFGFVGSAAWTEPVLAEGADRARAWRSLLETLRRRGHAILRMNCVSSLRWSDDDVQAAADAARALGARVATSNYGTYVNDLSLSEADRFKALDESHRRKVKAAIREKLGFETLDVAAFEDYVRMSDATFARQGIPGPSRAYLEGLRDTPSHFTFHAARNAEGVPQAVALIAHDRGTAYYLHGGSGLRPAKGAGNWLHWALMNHLAARGIARYDFGGVDLRPVHGQSDGIRAFKKSFGGEFREYRAIDVVFSPVKHRLIETGRALAAKVGL